MATTRKLADLFRAIAAEDLSGAASIASEICKGEERKGHRSAARVLRGALNANGASHAVPEAACLPDQQTIGGLFTTALASLSPEPALDDVVLVPSARRLLQSIVAEWKKRDVLHRRGLQPRSKLLFHGVPGCGKSLTARALAHELGIPVYVVRFDADPLKDDRYFVLALPVPEVEKRSKDKKRAPHGTYKEPTEFGGDHGRVFDRLGLDLLQVTDDGKAVVHAETEKFAQLLHRTESLDSLGPREQARWATIDSFETIPLDLRVDASWLQQVSNDEPTDMVIELQPVLSRADADRVLRAIADLLLQRHGEKLTGTGTDFSGRHWFRGKATRHSIRNIAKDFYSVQAIHSPLFSIAAAKKSSRTHPIPIRHTDAPPPADPSTLPCVAVIDMGIPSDHVHEKRVLLQDLDNFIFANDVLVVVAAGNSRPGVPPDQPYPDHHADERWSLGPWASGFNTLVCGAFVSQLSTNGLVQTVGWPSPFTRIGPGLCSAPIPSFSAEGGNTDDVYRFHPGLGVWGFSAAGLTEDHAGTSFAAPILAREAAWTLHQLQQHCTPGTQPFAVTARAFLTLTANRPVQDEVIKTLRLIVCSDPPVSEAAQAGWACRRVRPVLHLGPDVPSVRARAGVHPTFPVIDRHYALDRYKPGRDKPAEGDLWLLEIAYDEIAPYPPAMDFDPRQRVAFAAELVDKGEAAIDPQAAMQALPIATTMNRLSIQSTPIRSPIIIKTRV